MNKIKITKAFILDALRNRSSSENIGASQHLDDLIQGVTIELVIEEDAPASAFDFGKINVQEIEAVHLDEDSTPVLLYDMVFVDLNLTIQLEARHYDSWHYYVKAIKAGEPV